MFNCCQTRRLSTEVYRIINLPTVRCRKICNAKIKLCMFGKAELDASEFASMFFAGWIFFAPARTSFFARGNVLEAIASEWNSAKRTAFAFFHLRPLQQLTGGLWGFAPEPFKVERLQQLLTLRSNFPKQFIVGELRKAAYLHLICSSSVLDGAPFSPRPVAVCSSSSFVFLHFRLPPPLLYRRLTAMRLRLHVKRKLPTLGLIWTSYPLGGPCHWNYATPWGAYFTSLWPLTLNLLVVDVKLLRDNAWFGGIFSVHPAHQTESQPENPSLKDTLALSSVFDMFIIFNH